MSTSKPNTIHPLKFSGVKIEMVNCIPQLPGNLRALYIFQSSNITYKPSHVARYLFASWAPFNQCVMTLCQHISAFLSNSAHPLQLVAFNPKNETKLPPLRADFVYQMKFCRAPCSFLLTPGYVTREEHLYTQSEWSKIWPCIHSRWLFPDDPTTWEEDGASGKTLFDTAPVGTMHRQCADHI